MDKAINRCFEELTQFKGELYHFSGSLRAYSKNLVKDFERASYTNYKKRIVTVSRLAISDIVGETDNGWFYNSPLKPTYLVKVDNIKDKTELLILKVTAYTIVQAFESFLRFMRYSMLNYFTLNPAEGKRILQIKDEKKEFNWEKEYNKYKQINKKSDIEFQVLGNISERFKLGVKSNNYNFQLDNYLKVLIIVRNCIVHNNLILTKDDYNGLSSKKGLLDLLNYFFPIKHLKKDFKLDFNPEKAYKNINLIAEIGLLIFRAFSELLNYDWKSIYKKRVGTP